MGGLSASDYWDSVEYFCTLCRAALPEVLVSVIVVGSLSVGDVAPGWSDVDAYLVAKAVTEPVRRTVARLQAEVTRRYPWFATDRGSRFTVFTVSEEEVLHGGEEVSFLAQWDLKRHGIIACGRDLRPGIVEPPMDRSWLDRHTDWMIDFLAKQRNAPEYWRGVNAVGFILAGARVAVLKDGLYLKRKDEIAEAFSRRHPARAGVVADAMEARRAWTEVQRDPRRIAALYERAAGFLGWVRSLP